MQKTRQGVRDLGGNNKKQFRVIMDQHDCFANLEEFHTKDKNSNPRTHLLCTVCKNDIYSE